MKDLSRLLIVLGGTALVLIAEDFWVKKPYTDWSEKDAAKLLLNSPWSHEVIVTLGGGMGDRSGGGGRGGRGSTGGVNTGDVSPMSGGSGAGGEMAGGSGPGRGRPGSMGGDASGVGGGGGTASLTLHVRWQSAMPIRQAVVVAKLGREKAGSDQAKKFLEQQMPFYIVTVTDLPPQMIAGISDDHMTELAKIATLARKEKDPIAAASAQKVNGEPGAVAFLFPKTDAITLEDKEVEFVSKVGRLEVKRKFKLKDMMIGDKLEL
jgi:hypothetical protein